MKRMCSLVLALLMMLSICTAAAAPSRSETYDSCIEELRKYLNGEDCLPLEEVYAQLEDLNNYAMSYPLSKYAKILLDIEMEDFSWYIVPIQSMKQNERFVAWLAEEELLGSLDQLEAYASGREAEYNGEIDAAIASYMNCIGFFDAERRLDTLCMTSFEEKYQQAVAEAKKKTADGYQRAYELMLEIEQAGGYLDSAFMLEGLRALCATPTPKPTRVPTATPFNLANARFCSESSRSTIIYGYELIGRECMIEANSARTRTGPGVEYPQTFEYVFSGERFEIYDIDVATDNKVWYYIRVDGQYCWVSSGVASVNDLCSYILLR